MKVLDFGLAKILDAPDLDLTGSGTIVGTPHYMSPEQAQGLPLDHRTDIYALGVTLFKALTGQTPFRSDGLVGLVVQIATCEVPSLPAARLGAAPVTLADFDASSSPAPAPSSLARC